MPMADCGKHRKRSEDTTMNIEMPHQKLDLSSAIAEGDIRVLLMVLVHMTGDERWLEPPYKPKRDVRLIPDPEAGVPQKIQDEIRAAVLRLFANGEPRPAITDPGDELMLRMMRACLGENVAPEYAPLRLASHSAASAFPTPSLKRTTSLVAPGTSTDILVAVSIRPIIPTRSRSARGITGPAISRSAKNCSTI